MTTLDGAHQLLTPENGASIRKLQIDCLLDQLDPVLVLRLPSLNRSEVRWFPFSFTDKVLNRTYLQIIVTGNRLEGLLQNDGRVDNIELLQQR